MEAVLSAERDELAVARTAQREDNLVGAGLTHRRDGDPARCADAPGGTASSGEEPEDRVDFGLCHGPLGFFLNAVRIPGAAAASPVGPKPTSATTAQAMNAIAPRRTPPATAFSLLPEARLALRAATGTFRLPL